MRTRKWLLLAAALVLLAPAGVGQDSGQKNDKKKDQNKTEQPAAEMQADEGERGIIEFGGRAFTGDVYGRHDLPYKPNLATSHLNQYSDIRNNFLLRRARISEENVFGSPYYVRYQTVNSFYRDQSHLATFGQYNKFTLQVRY